MALDKFQPYLFVSAGEQSNKYLTPVISPDGIASFQAQRAQDLTGLTVRIDPIQEGTGDPYPAGGGKNLLNPSAFVQREGYNNLSVSSSGNVITITGYDAGGRFACFNVPTTVGQAYTVKLTARNNVTTVSVVESDTQPTAWISGGTAVGVNVAYTYTATKAWAQVWVELSANNATVTNLQFEKGSSATDWSPYSNICPISGRTGLTVTAAGKNLLPSHAVGSTTVYGVTFDVREDGSIRAHGTATQQADFPIVKQNELTLDAGTYTVKRTPADNIQYITGGASNTSGLTYTIVSRTSDATFTISNSGTTGHNILRVLSGATVDAVFYPQIEKGSTSTEYAPYAGQTYPITWESIAGTVYGGTLDVVSGVLTVTHKLWTDNGTRNWARNVDGSFYTASGSETSVQSADGCACNYAPYVISFNDVTVFVRSNGLVNLGRGWGSLYATVEDLKAAFAQTPLQIVYPLATPQTYQLTPTEVRTIAGFNQIYSDAGPVIDIKF